MIARSSHALGVLPLPGIASKTTRILTLALLVVSLAAMSSCNIVGPIAYIVHGPPKVKALHELSPKLRTVIFVDDRANRLPRRSLKNVIGQRAEETLIDRGAVPQANMITSRSATIAASNETNSDLMSIASIGEAIGVDRVIYVSIEGFSITRDGVTVQPVAGALVKVIDVEEDRRVWPADRKGFPVKVQLPATGAPIPRDRAGVNRIQIGLAEILGVQIARVFFKYERDTLSGKLDD